MEAFAPEPDASGRRTPPGAGSGVQRLARGAYAHSQLYVDYHCELRAPVFPEWHGGADAGAVGHRFHRSLVCFYGGGTYPYAGTLQLFAGRRKEGRIASRSFPCRVAPQVLRTGTGVGIGSQAERTDGYRCSFCGGTGLVLYLGTQLSALVQRRFVHHQCQFLAGHFVGRVRQDRAAGRGNPAFHSRNTDRGTQDGACRAGRTCAGRERVRAGSSLRVERPLAPGIARRGTPQAFGHYRSQYRDRPAHQPPHRCHAERHAGEHRHQALRG